MQLTRPEIARTQVIVTTPEKWDVVTRKPTGEGEIASVCLLWPLSLATFHGPISEPQVINYRRSPSAERRERCSDWNHCCPDFAPGESRNKGTITHSSLSGRVKSIYDSNCGVERNSSKLQRCGWIFEVFEFYVVIGKIFYGCLNNLRSVSLDKKAFSTSIHPSDRFP